MNAKNFTLFCLILIITLLLGGCSSIDAKAPRVFFTNVKTGDTVKNPIVLQWSAENFRIEPAGEVRDKAGHLHILVNTDCLAAGEAIPNDETHLHFGKAQTETELSLAPGAYTLCLQAADGEHKALSGNGMTQVVEITVDG